MCEHPQGRHVLKMRKDVNEKLRALSLILDNKDEEVKDKKQFNILLIEEDVRDIPMINQALEESKLNYSMTALNSASAALKYIDGETPYKDMPIPDFIILDLDDKGPGGSRQVLDYLKDKEHLRYIPVLLICDESCSEHVLERNTQRADATVRRPFKMPEFSKALYGITKFWSIVEGVNNITA